MDKLKENAYWISLGAVVLVLLLLTWFLVVARIYGGSGDTVTTLGARLEKSLKSIESYKRREFVPTEDYETHLKAALERVRLDHNDGAAVYNDRQAKFNEIFPGMGDGPPDPGLFASTYHEKIKALLEAYREKFGIKAPDPEATDRDKDQVEIPTVDRLDQAEIFDDATVRIAMKEYWIVEAIFEALTQLEVGGLQKVGFPGRLANKDDEDDNEHFGTIEVVLTVEMPFSKIEDFITQLFDDDRVLFVFDGLEMKKTVEDLKPFMTLKKVADFESRDDADRAKYADVVTEPNISVDFTFRILDWKGHPIIERGDLEDGGEDGEFEEESEEDDGVVRKTGRR